MYAISCLAICPLLTAQQPTQAASTPATASSAVNAEPPVDAMHPSAASERNLAIKKARTLFISSDTAYLTVSTLDRALLKQKDWDRLGLNIVDNTVGADLELKVDRLVLTHIHTYVLTDKATGIVLASGRVRAFDGVVASDPMAEQIVKALSAARLSSRPISDQGF
jgi:hypothetical protein